MLIIRWKYRSQAPVQQVEILLSRFPECAHALDSNSVGIIWTFEHPQGGFQLLSRDAVSDGIWWWFPEVGDSGNFRKNEDLSFFFFSFFPPVHFRFHAVSFAGLEGPLGVMLQGKVGWIGTPKETLSCFTGFNVFCVLFSPRECFLSECKLILDQWLEAMKKYLM